MTQWTSQQLKCLEAIGVPVYEHLLPAPPAKAVPDEEHDNAAYYKLGPWAFEFSDILPVESYDWLRDLAAYCQSNPVQISAGGDRVCVKKYSRSQLSPADKKELWHLLKANL